MKISSLRIQKFRSIDDATIYFGQVLAIVGANNVGKSHVLRALNAFFNFQDERERFQNRDHSYSSNARPRITVTFDEISDQDEIDEEYIFAGKLTLSFIYRRDRANPIYEVHLGADKRTIDSDTFTRLIAHFRYIYVPIIRDYDTSFATGTGIAYRLLSRTLQQQIQNRNTVQPHVDRLYDKIESTVHLLSIPILLRAIAQNIGLNIIRNRSIATNRFMPQNTITRSRNGWWIGKRKALAPTEIHIGRSIRWQKMSVQVFRARFTS